MIISKAIHDNIINLLKKNNPKKSEKTVEDWFRFYDGEDVEDYYGCDIIKSEFDAWINGGMNDQWAIIKMF